MKKKKGGEDFCFFMNQKYGWRFLATPSDHPSPSPSFRNSSPSPPTQIYHNYQELLVCLWSLQTEFPPTALIQVRIRLQPPPAWLLAGERNTGLENNGNWQGSNNPLSLPCSGFSVYKTSTWSLDNPGKRVCWGTVFLFH